VRKRKTKLLQLLAESCEYVMKIRRKLGYIMNLAIRFLKPQTQKRLNKKPVKNQINQENKPE
jgi:hypothetical protein